MGVCAVRLMIMTITEASLILSYSLEKTDLKALIYDGYNADTLILVQRIGRRLDQ